MNNQILNMFVGINGFNQQLKIFASQINQTNPGATPQQLVQQMLNSGRMTQDQFNQFREIANQITGKNF